MAESRLDLIRVSARTVGRVHTVAPGSVTITTPTGQMQRINTTATTIVVKAEKGTPADLEKGSRVVLKFRPGAPRDAVEAIALPTENIHGLLVTAVAPGSMTVKSLLGDLTTLNTHDVTVDTTTIASLSEVTEGATVFVQAKISDAGDLTADEVIVLPSGTAFGT